MSPGRSVMNEDEQALLMVNRDTFAAEGHEPVDGWLDILHCALADDFRLRRGIGEIEDRERMITRLSRTKPAPRKVIEEAVAVLGDTGVVRSQVRVGASSFRNVKLFERTAEGWRCVYWRVSRE